MKQHLTFAGILAVGAVAIVTGSLYANQSAAFDESQKKAYVQKLRDREKLVQQEIEIKKSTRDRLEEEIKALNKYEEDLDRAVQVTEAANAQVWDDRRAEADRLLVARTDPKPLMASPLEKEWDGVKKDYHAKFQKAIDEIDAQIAALKNERDFGDAGRRDQIAEQLNDLERSRARLEEIGNELRAATAVDWLGLKTRVTDAIEDMKD